MQLSSVLDVALKSLQSRNVSGACVQLIEIALTVVKIYMLTPHWGLLVCGSGSYKRLWFFSSFFTEHKFISVRVPTLQSVS